MKDYLELRNDLENAMCNLSVAAYLLHLYTNAPDYLHCDALMQAEVRMFVEDNVHQKIKEVDFSLRKLFAAIPSTQDVA